MPFEYQEPNDSPSDLIADRALEQVEAKEKVQKELEDVEQHIIDIQAAIPFMEREIQEYKTMIASSDQVAKYMEPGAERFSVSHHQLDQELTQKSKDLFEATLKLGSLINKRSRIRQQLGLEESSIVKQQKELARINRIKSAIWTTIAVVLGATAIDYGVFVHSDTTGDYGNMLAARVERVDADARNLLGKDRAAMISELNEANQKVLDEQLNEEITRRNVRRARINADGYRSIELKPEGLFDSLYIIQNLSDEQFLALQQIMSQDESVIAYIPESREGLRDTVITSYLEGGYRNGHITLRLGDIKHDGDLLQKGVNFGVFIYSIPISYGMDKNGKWHRSY